MKWSPFVSGCTVVFLLTCCCVPIVSAHDSPAIVSARTLSEAFRQAIRTVKPAVVSIEASLEPETDETSTSWFGNLLPNQGGSGNQDSPEWQGSGVIVSPLGEILTNNHVVSYNNQPANNIRVTLDSNEEYRASIVYTDPETDIAVLSIERDTPFPFATIGDSDAMQVGDWVLAIGNPFGLRQSVSQGIVSATGRTNTEVDVVIKDYIQTTAAINMGNSGGPLINLDGEIIGLNNAIHTAFGVPANIGIGFAIPSNMVKRVVADLRQYGIVNRGFLGVTLSEDDGLIQSFRDEYNVNYGALVERVLPGLSADWSGLQVDDLIIEVDGQRVANHGDLINKISRFSAGDTTNLTVIRDRERFTRPVTLMQRMDWRELITLVNRDEPEADSFWREIGLRVETLTPARASELGYNDTLEGAVVTWIRPGGAASEIDIRVGDVIVDANSSGVDSAETLKSILSTIRDEMAEQRDDERPVLLEIHRAGSRFHPSFVAITLSR